MNKSTEIPCITWPLRNMNYLGWSSNVVIYPRITCIYQPNHSLRYYVEIHEIITKRTKTLFLRCNDAILGRFFYSLERCQNNVENLMLLNRCRILLSNVRLYTSIWRQFDVVSDDQPFFEKKESIFCLNDSNNTTIKKVY